MQNCPLKSTSFRCHIVGIFYMGILSKKALKSRVSNCNNSRNIGATDLVDPSLDFSRWVLFILTIIIPIALSLNFGLTTLPLDQNIFFFHEEKRRLSCSSNLQDQTQPFLELAPCFALAEHKTKTSQLPKLYHDLGCWKLGCKAHRNSSHPFLRLLDHEFYILMVLT